MAHATEASLVTQPDRLLRFIQRHVADQIKIPFEIRLWGEHSYRFGKGEPAIKIFVRNREGLTALNGLDEVRICEAYMAGSLDVVGDMLGFVSLRRALSDRHPLHQCWRRLAPLFIGRGQTDRRAIASHYDFDNEFYFTFMDRTRCYSQALFEGTNESLETAQRRKLDFVIDACALQPGQRVLDVGGGWGSFMEHAAGRYGIEVTSLTISHQSEVFLTGLIERLQPRCRVLNQDFLGYTETDSYDAIVVLGVMEHLPDYPAVLQQFQRLLKPGGRVYMDASAYRETYSKPTFVSRYIFPGDHSYFCLHTFLAAVAKGPLEVQAVHNDRYSYFLTCKAWAENLEAAREQIVKRWGEMLYRRFQLYLWGSAYAFLSRGMDAYRVILQRPADC